jgi:hypothetical protein
MAAVNFTTDQIAALPTSVIAALSTADIQGLTTDHDLVGVQCLESLRCPPPILVR